METGDYWTRHIVASSPAHVISSLLSPDTIKSPAPPWSVDKWMSRTLAGNNYLYK
jgi:hypothetical protein